MSVLARVVTVAALPLLAGIAPSSSAHGASAPQPAAARAAVTASVHAGIAARTDGARSSRGAVRSALVAPQRVAALAPSDDVANVVVQVVAKPKPKPKPVVVKPRKAPPSLTVAADEAAPTVPSTSGSAAPTGPTPDVPAPSGGVPTGGSTSTILSAAAALAGIPYKWGGTTPSGFDCSGYTQYVFAKAGISLPRTAAQQFAATTPVPAGKARPGDLVFFGDGPEKWHVGIFAGNGMLWHSPKPGKSVSLVPLWTSDVTYGRASR